MTLSTGESLRFPVPIRDVTQFIAVYAVRSADIARLLPPDLRPLESGYGLGLMHLYWLEAGDSGFGPFREFALNFSVREPVRGAPAIHYHANPISTERGRLAGFEAWGHPTSLAKLEIERDGEWNNCTVSDDGDFVLSLATRARPQGPLHSDGLLTTSADFGRRRRSSVYRFVQSARAAQREERPQHVELKLGTHPLAAQIDALLLDRQPLYTLYYTGSTILSGPRLSDLDERKH